MEAYCSLSTTLSVLFSHIRATEYGNVTGRKDSHCDGGRLRSVHVLLECKRTIEVAKESQASISPSPVSFYADNAMSLSLISLCALKPRKSLPPILPPHALLPVLSSKGPTSENGHNWSVCFIQRPGSLGARILYAQALASMNLYHDPLLPLILASSLVSLY